MRHKNIEAFVRYWVKKQTSHIDEVELQTLFDQMSIDELQKFWLHFTASLAFSKANLAVPDWKTKQQQAYFQHELNSYLFYPTEKDTDGKYIIDRKEFEEHIRTYLIKHIEAERQLQNIYKNRPLLTKIHNIVGFSIVIMAFLLPVYIFLPNIVSVPVAVLFGVLWAMYLILGIVRLLIRQ